MDTFLHDTRDIGQVRKTPAMKGIVPASFGRGNVAKKGKNFLHTVHSPIWLMMTVETMNAKCLGSRLSYLSARRWNSQPGQFSSYRHSATVQEDLFVCQ